MPTPKLLPPATLLLLRDIENYLDLTGISRTAFGLEAAGDGHFIRRLESGREPRYATITRVRRFLEQPTTVKKDEPRHAARGAS